MTALRDAIDYTTLGWVKPELDETLRQTQMEIEGFAEEPGDPSRMRYAAGLLHQVQGTLRMVELYAPAMVAEEMESLAKAIATDSVSDRDEACATLMRGVVLLPDYLERLQSGHKDIPIVLLPLLNELRSVRGEKGLNESVLFAPDLDRPLPTSLPAPAGASNLQNSADAAPLLASLRDLLANSSESQPCDYGQLVHALEGLLALTQDPEARRMLWVAGETASALRDGAMTHSSALRDAFGSVEREARRLFEGGAAVVSSSSQLEPTRQLLFHVASGEQAHPSLDKLRATFDLSARHPSESELEHARGSVSGRNRALLDTVSAAIKEDLLRIKDALDLYLRTSRDDANELQPQVEALDRVADTLGMLGLGVARNVVLQQRDALRGIVFGGRSPDEAALLDVAGALLYVDASLDDQVARLGQPGSGAEDDLAGTEARKVLEVLVREAIANFADARQGFVAFVETSWDHSQLTEVPRLLAEVAGALRMLELPLPAEYLTGVRRYTETELIARKRVPSGLQLDTLADSLASLEYYLEAVRDQRHNGNEILAITRQSLETLRYWPLPPETEEPPHAAGLDSQAAWNASADTGPEVAAAPPAPHAAPDTHVSRDSTLAPAVAVVGSFDRSNDEIDDEIREVFLEEFEEEIANLDSLLPKWREQPDDMERLRPIRRVFHTLKGSGRLVGAKVLGEFSWKVESMFNRVLDGSRPPSAAVFAVVDHAVLVLPQLHAALRDDTALHVDLVGLEAIADRVAAGEDVRYVPREIALSPDPAPEAVIDAPAAGNDAAESDGSAGLMVPVSVDAVLLEILAAEVEGHLATVDGWLARSREQQHHVDDAMLRAIHTMNGAFAMSEVPEITDATTPAEAYVKRLLGANEMPDQAGVAALEDLATQIRATMAGLLSPASAVPTQTELALRLINLRDSLPETSMSIFDTALAGESPVFDTAQFAAEADEANRVELERAEAERAEAERVEAERAEAERAEAERAEAERAEAERAEAERVDAERVEAERAGPNAWNTSCWKPSTLKLTGSPESTSLKSPASTRHAPTSASKPNVPKPNASKPNVPKPNGWTPSASRPSASKPNASKPNASKPNVSRPNASKPNASRPNASKPNASRPNASRPNAPKPNASRPNASRPNVPRPNVPRPNASRPNASKPNVSRPNASRPNASRPNVSSVEAERVEAERVEAERVEAERAEAERIEAQRLELARANTPGPDRKQGKKDKKDKARQAAIESAATAAAVAAPVAAVLAAGDDPDAPLDLTDLDPELVDIFVEEGGDLLDHSDGLLSLLRDAPNEREPVVGLQRDLHTLKGGARMAGIMAVGELGHAMESLLEAVAEQRSELGRDDIPLLERGFDRLHAMITRVGARQAIGMPIALIEAFDARARGMTAALLDGRTPDEGPSAPKTELKPLSAPIDTGQGDDDEIEIRAPQEQVRIRADLLDRLVNYAGEVAIYRARLEQQLGAFRGAMSEMEQTNARLRDQLRRLDSETEAQIVARYQREQETIDPRFDPLELDRFSTLQQLSRGLGESAADMASLQGSLEDLTRQYETLLLQQSRVSSDLQEGLMRTRMVPFDALVPRLRRVLRQAATDTGKQVQLKLDGAQGELDRTVLERMTAPLEHMLRNAVAHGLETPAQRRKAGKPEEGVVRIAMRREGSEVVLEVADDGAGLNRAAIRRRAEERGLIRSDAILADADLDALILEPGFSTADEVSRLAGRGVGMDVVHSEVRQLGGALDIQSRPDEGVTFTLRLPQTLAVTQAVFVRIGETNFAVPIASVRGVGRISREELGKGDASYSYGGEDYALHDLGTLIGHASAKAEGQLQMPLLLIRAGDLRAAVSVDQVIGNREIVVKPVGPQIASVPGIFGATIMGDGGVVVILDVAPLVRRQVAAPRAPVLVQVSEARGVPLVMVVDDSVTMRKVTGRVLERNNFEVTTARDGIDALERMAERVPDLMLLDIEMPRMDGYELATAMKQDPRLRDVPIIMITSRTGEKHRQRALDIGVQRYLGKPYQEPELMRNVFELLQLNRDHG